MTTVAWFSIWFVLVIMVLTSGRDGKGIFTRKVLRFIPPRRWWTPGTFGAINYRYILLWGAASVAQVFTPHAMDELVWWAPQIMVLLDDWLFHDTNWKKKLDMVRNKIKWRMKLPEPLHDQVAS